MKLTEAKREQMFLAVWDCDVWYQGPLSQAADPGRERMPFFDVIEEAVLQIGVQ